MIFFSSQSKDKTVFFFAVEDKYEPIGFICVPGPVQALQWSPPSHVSNACLFSFTVLLSFPTVLNVILKRNSNEN